VQYIDVQDAFAGHELCDPAQKAVNGLTEGDDLIIDGLGPIGNESYHPNELGHQLMSSVLIQQSERLSKPMPVADDTVKAPYKESDVYRQFIGDAPSGFPPLPPQHPITNVKNVDLKGSTIAPRTDIPLRPNSTFDASFHSTPTPAGMLTTDADGHLTGEITVPDSLEPGYHTLHLYGQNLSGQQVDLYKLIYVAASIDDIDGDDIPNDGEKCLAVEPANVDFDRDGIDDACDPEITEPPADAIPPMVIGTPDRSADANGWYNHDVTINWTATDPDPSSGTPTQPAPTTAGQEGDHTYTSGSSCDPAGNCASGQLRLKIDKTGPTLGSVAWTNNPKSDMGTATLSVPIADNLSGVEEAEYYLGDTDPGPGNGATMQVNDGLMSVDFGTDFPTGVYKVTVRAKDKAGNWSLPTSDYLVVYDPFGVQMTGQKKLLPSLENGDVLPGLTTGAQGDKARFGFNVRYDNQGGIHPESDFQFSYKTGDDCNNPSKATNCHNFELNASSIAWLTTQDPNDSIGIFQGEGVLRVDGVRSAVIFRVTGLDSERLDTESQDHLTVMIYGGSANPNGGPPLYQINDDIQRGNIKIRKW
jgi:hypothetical protein